MLCVVPGNTAAGGGGGEEKKWQWRRESSREHTNELTFNLENG